MTTLLYLEDSYLLYTKASVLKTGKDDKGLFIVLDQTIFYPQGGVNLQTKEPLKKIFLK